MIIRAKFIAKRGHGSINYLWNHRSRIYAKSPSCSRVARTIFNSTKVFDAKARRNDRSNLHGTSKNRSPWALVTRINSLVDLHGFRYFSHCAKHYVALRSVSPEFLCNFLRSERRAFGTKGPFPVHRDLVGVQTKRDYPRCDERVIKTKYGSELMIILFAVSLQRKL